MKSVSIEKQERKGERERDTSIYRAQGLYIHSSLEPIILVCMISM